MKQTSHLRSVSRQRPSAAALSPIWELFYLTESFLGLFGTYAGLGLQFLNGYTSLAQTILSLKGGSSQT